MGIAREDMLELTRRMNLQRNCFSRIAGAYLDAEGFVDGTFHQHFQNLTKAEQKEKIEIAKTVVFAETNVCLKELVYPAEEGKQGNTWKILTALKDCELKNDALLDIMYEEIGSRYKSSAGFAVFFFYGAYDVMLKAADKESLWESEEVYHFLICAVCPLVGDYEPGMPEWGFLFPAFKDRSSDEYRMNVFHRDSAHPQKELLEFLKS